MQNTNVAEQKRPFGVSFIAILEGLQGIFLIIIGSLALLALAAPTQHVTIQGTAAPLSANTIAAVIGGFLVVIGLFSLLFSWGLWRLKRWAFWLTVISQVLSLISSITQLTQPNSNTGSSIAGMVIPIVLLLYFLADARVRAAFRA